MKKLIVMGIVATMVMGLAVGASAFQFKAQADDGTGSNYMSALTWGTYSGTIASPMGANPGTAAELALAGNQDWDPTTFGAVGDWKVMMLAPTAPEGNLFNFGLWAGSEYAATNATVTLWLYNDAGLDLSKPYEFKNVKSGVVYWTGTIDSTKKTKANPIFSYSLAVPKTSAPDSNAYLCSFGEVVPEPGSMLAMLSGLVGLVGFGIRRRK